MFCQRLMLSFFLLWRFRDMFSWLCQSSLKATSAGRSSTKENLTGTLYLHRSRNPWATIWDIHPDIYKAMWRLTNLTNMTSSTKQSTGGSPRTWRRNASAVHRSAANLDSWTRREEKMSPSLKSACFPLVSALIKVRGQSPAWAAQTNLTLAEHGSEFCHYLGSTAETICGHLRTADTRCTRGRLQDLLMLWTRRKRRNASWKKLHTCRIAIVSKMRMKLSPELDSALTCKHLDWCMPIVV